MLARTDLYPYQTRAVEFIKRHERCALFVDMGLGKTISGLTAFSDLQGSFDATRALVVAPLRVARRVWSDEVATWAHVNHLRVSRIVGTATERTAAMAVDADVYTIGRENVQWLEQQFIQNRKQVKHWPWDTVILDESQSFKSQGSERFKSMRRLQRLFPRLVELTGTPSPNGYSDLWSQVYLLDLGKRLGATETAYRERWFDPPEYNTYGWRIKDGAAPQIQAAMADIVLSLRAEDYLDLPPVVYNPIYLDLPPAAMQQYRKFEKTYLTRLPDERLITAANAGVLLGKLLQFANGALYTDDQHNYEEVHREKLDGLLELLDSLPSPVLVAYEFVSDLRRISETLARYCGKSKTFEVLRSDASFDSWRAGLVDFGIIHPGSAGHGLNDLYVSGSENIVWFGLTPNLEHYQQLNARLTGGHRRTGKNIVIHHLLARGTRDEAMLELLSHKDWSQNDLKTVLSKWKEETL